MQSAFQSIEHTLDGIMFTTAVYALNQGSFHRDKAKAVVQGVLIVRGLGYRVYHVRPCRLCFLRIKFHGYRNPPLSIATFINRLRADFHYDSDSKALKPVYFRNHLINSSVAMILSSRSMVQPCGR